MTELYGKVKKLESKRSYEAFDELRDMSFQQTVFSECEPSEIADYVNIIGEDDNLIINHFGEGSLEHIAYMHLFEEQYQESIEKKHNIPGRGEDPTITYGMLRRWIIDFHELNDKPLPKGFHDKNKKQLLGMFYGMQDSYNFSIDDIVQKLD